MGAEILLLGCKDRAGRAQAGCQTAWTQGPQGCQVTLAQSHLSPKKEGQRQDPEPCFQPKVPNSSCPREPPATSPSVLWDLGMIPVGAWHPPHPTAQMTSMAALPASTPHHRRGAGPPIAMAPLAEHPVPMGSSSVPKSHLHHPPCAKILPALPAPQGQAGCRAQQAPRRDDELRGNKLGT